MSDEEVKIKVGLDTSDIKAEFFKGLFEGMQQEVKKVVEEFGNLKKANEDLQGKVKDLSAANVELKDKLKEAGQAGAEAGNGMSNAFSTLKGVVAAAAAAFAALKIRDVVDEVANGVKEFDSLANKMNMSKTAAQAFADAIEDAELSTEDITGAMQKLSKGIATNEARMNELGVVTRNAKGELLSQVDVFQNAVKALNNFTPGMDRAAASTEIFGRANLDLVKAAMVTSEAIKKSEEDLKELGLTYDEQSSKVYGDYRQSVRDNEDAIKGFKKVIADELLPIMTEANQAFRQAAPEAIRVFKEAMQEIVPIVMGVKTAVVDTFVGIYNVVFKSNTDTAGNTKDTWMFVSDTIGAAVSVIGGLLIGLTGVFSAAWEAIKGIVRGAVYVIMGFLDALKERLAGIGTILRAVATGDGDKIGAAVAEVNGKVNAAARRGVDGLADELSKAKDKINNIRQETVKSIDKLATDTATAMNKVKVKAPEMAEDKGVKPPTKAYVPKAAGGGGGGKSGEDNALAKSLVEIAKQEAEAELRIYKEQLKAEEAALKVSLDQKKISQEEYASKIGALKQKEIDAEIKARQAERAAIQMQLEEATKRGAKESEINGIKAKAIQIDSQIAVLELKKTDQVRQTTAEIEKASKASDKQLQTFRGQLAALTGVGVLQAKLGDIAQKFNDLAPNIRENPLAQELKRAEESVARLGEIERKNSQDKELAEARVNSLVEQGLLSQGTGKNKLLEVERQLLATKLQGLQVERDMAAAAGDDGRLQKLEREIELTQLRNETIKEGAAEQKQFASDLQNSMQSNIEGLLNGTKSLKDALLGVAKDIVGSINKMIAKKISESLTDSIMGGKDGKGGIFAGLFGGGGKSDTSTNDLLAQSAQQAAGSLTNMAQNGADMATKSIGEQVIKTGMQTSTTQTATSGLQALAQAAQQAAQALSSISSQGGGGGGLLGGGDMFGDLLGGGGGGMFGGSGGLFGGWFGDLFGGFFEEGGYQFADKPYIVGERGPELFVPSQAGTVVPNGGMGGATNVYMTVKTPDASSFRRSTPQVMTDYNRAMSRANRRNG